MDLLVDIVIRTPEGAQQRIQATRDLTTPPPVSEPVDAQPFSHGFTGKHDSGDLPSSGRNMYSQVIDAVQEAKAITDTYIQTVLPDKTPAPQAKKARVGEPKDDAADDDGNELPSE